MALDKQEIVDVYRRRASGYDLTAQSYYLVGFREWAYRQKAVNALALKRGDTVLEIGCGTGLNFRLLEEKIGTEGKILGVDMTDSMLARARDRVQQNGWPNVELVQSDAAIFQFPRGVNGVISTFALTLVPEFRDVILAGSEALLPGGRFVILDFKLPTNRLSRLAPLFALTLRPFGVSLDLASRHPWEAMKRHLTNVSMTELYGGMAYVAAGERAVEADYERGVGNVGPVQGASDELVERKAAAKRLSTPTRRTGVMAKHPVCGMSLDPQHAVGSHEEGGKTYYFCSAHCAAKFQAEPARYLGNEQDEPERLGPVYQIEPSAPVAAPARSS